MTMIWSRRFLLLVLLFPVVWSGNGSEQDHPQRAHRRNELLYLQKNVKSQTKQSSFFQMHHRDRLRKEEQTPTLAPNESSAPSKTYSQQHAKHKSTKAGNALLFGVPNNNNIFDKHHFVPAAPTTATAHPTFDRGQSYYSSTSSAPSQQFSTHVPSTKSLKSSPTTGGRSSYYLFNPHNIRSSTTKSSKSLKSIKKESSSKSQTKTTKSFYSNTLAPTTTTRITNMPTRTSSSPIATTTTSRPQTLPPATDVPSAVGPSTTFPTMATPTFVPSLAPMTAPPTVVPTLSTVPSTTPSQSPTTTSMPTSERGVLFFRLWNTESNTLAFPNSTLGNPMEDNDEYSLTDIGTSFLTIEAVTNPTDLQPLDGQVRIQLYDNNDPTTPLHEQIEFRLPYVLFGDNGVGDVAAGLEFVEGINYRVVAEAFDGTTNQPLGVERTVGNVRFVT